MVHFKRYFCSGEMSEWFNEAVLKTVDPKGPGVRIPLSPLRPINKDVKSLQILLFAGFLFWEFIKKYQNITKSQ